MELLLDPFLYVNFQRAKHLFVPLDGRLQSKQHSLCRIKVGNDPIRNRNRCRRNANRLRIETKIHNQFFRRAGDSAKVGVSRTNIGVVKLNGHGSRFRCLRFRHDQFVKKELGFRTLTTTVGATGKFWEIRIFNRKAAPRW